MQSDIKHIALDAASYETYNRELDVFLHELIEPTKLHRKIITYEFAIDILLNPN